MSTDYVDAADRALVSPAETKDASHVPGWILGEPCPFGRLKAKFGTLILQQFDQAKCF